MYWRVERGYGVAAGNQAIACKMLNAMCGQLSIPAIEDDLTRLQFGEIAATHGDGIARPDGGQHACPDDLEPDLAGTASHVMDEFATRGVALSVCVHESRNLGSPAVKTARSLGVLHLAT
jgi:hypothetical protein